MSDDLRAKLEKMSAVDLRKLARDEKLPITYLSQHSKAALVNIVEAALRERGA